MRYHRFIIMIAAFAVLLILSCGKSSNYGSIKIPQYYRSKYTIINKGVPGNTSTDMVARVDTAVVSLKPNLVIIMIGTNNVTKNTPTSKYIADLTFIIHQLRSVYADVLLLSPPPRGKNTSDLSNFANKRTDTLAMVLDSLSKGTGCHYYDLNKAFKTAGSPNATSSSMINNAANNPSNPDGIHLITSGNAFIASIVVSQMQKNSLMGCYKIVCFGDSLTYEGGSDSYPSLLASILKNYR